MTVLPKLLSLFQRIDVPLYPPLTLITKIMKFPVVNGAKRHCPFVTDFTPHGPQLSKKDTRTYEWFLENVAESAD